MGGEAVVGRALADRGAEAAGRTGATRAALLRDHAAPERADRTRGALRAFLPAAARR
jgi:hypothetical protein